MRYFLIFSLVMGFLPAPVARASLPKGERARLYQLAVEEARRQGLEKDPEVQQELDQVLYRAFLRQRLKQAGGSLAPSDDEVKREYEARPWVRVRELVLLAGNPAQARIAARSLSGIDAALEKGAKFQDLVLRYSQDETASRGGDLDYRGADSLPAPVREAARSLAPGRISAPLPLPGAVALIQLVDRKSFADAPATYRQRLQSDLGRRRRLQYLEAQLESLSRERKPTP